MLLSKLRQRLQQDEGFTLIELLVVLVIIAVLLAIAVPSYLGFKDRAEQRAAASNVRATIPAVEAWYSDHNNYNFVNAARLRLSYDAGLAATVIATPGAGDLLRLRHAGHPHLPQGGSGCRDHVGRGLLTRPRPREDLSGGRSAPPTLCPQSGIRSRETETRNTPEGVRFAAAGAPTECVRLAAAAESCTNREGRTWALSESRRAIPHDSPADHPSEGSAAAVQRTIRQLSVPLPRKEQYMLLSKLRQRLQQDEGFTLIELLVVLVIIAVLLAIAVPSYLGFKDRAERRAAGSNVRATIPAVEAWYWTTTTTTSWTRLGSA